MREGQRGIYVCALSENMHVDALIIMHCYALSHQKIDDIHENKENKITFRFFFMNTETPKYTHTPP